MLTGTGRSVAVTGVLLLVAGVLLRYPELVLLGLACALALLAAAAWMLLRPHVEARREIQPVRVGEGEIARAVLTVRNLVRRRSPPILALERFGTREIAVPLPSLPGEGASTAVYPLPTDKRGLYPVGPLTIGHTDPFRLLRTGATYASKSVLRVHPRVLDVGALPTGQARDMEGPTSDTAPRGGIAFHSLREYEPGDDLRLISWRASAKMDKLMVRHNVVPNEPRLMVVLDTSRASYPDSIGGERAFEDAVRAAASLCAAACRERFPLELRTTGGVSGVAERSPDVAPVLDLLAEVQRGDPDHDAGLRGLLLTLPQQDSVTLGVVTGSPSYEHLAAVAAVRPRFQMVSVVQIGERHGAPATPVGGALVVAAEDSEDFVRAWNGLVRT